MSDSVTRLQQQMADGGERAFDIVPLILANVIKERQWEGRLDKNDKPFASFESFVTHRLIQGLESSIDDLLVFCRKKPDVQRLILAEVGPERGHRGSTKEERGNRGDIITSTERGTNATYALKRLKRDRPDLAERVVAGELSANKAAIEAGFRKHMITIPHDPYLAAVALARRFTQKECAEIRRVLREITGDA